MMLHHKLFRPRNTSFIRRAFSSSASSSKEMHDKLLMASFIHAKKLGFNDAAITAACHDFELPGVSGSILKNGPYDIVRFAMNHWLQALKEDAASHTFEESATSKDKLHFTCKHRLTLMSPYIKVWPQAMLLGVQPAHLKTTLSDLTMLSDEMWHIAGDKSTDMHWYARRALLLKAYAFTETHMLAD